MGVFSPNGQYFYTLRHNRKSGIIDTVHYIQLDLSDIENKIMIEDTIGYLARQENENTLGIGAINKGPNDKVYFTNATSTIVSSVEKPDLQGEDANFIAKRFLLSGGGLKSTEFAPLILMNEPINLDIPADTILCTENVLTIDLSTYPGSFTWEDESQNPIRQINKSGTYYVDYTSELDCLITDTIKVRFSGGGTTRDTLICHDSSFIYQGKEYKVGEMIIDTSYMADCFAIDTIHVLERTLLLPDGLDLRDTSVCGHSLAIALGVSDNFDVLWQDGIQSGDRVISGSGHYYVTITDSDGCSISDSFRVDFMPPEVNELDTLLCPEEYLIINGDTINNDKYIVDTIFGADCYRIMKYAIAFDDADLSRDTVYQSIPKGTSYQWEGEYYDSPGFYTYTLISDNGCAYTRYLKLDYLKSSDIFIPNIISANGDDYNDALMIQTSGDQSIMVQSFYVFDRFGSILHLQENTMIGEILWPANKQEQEDILPGVYVYFITLDDERVITGDITVIK